MRIRALTRLATLGDLSLKGEVRKTPSPFRERVGVRV
jgi:hypothetical protein